MIVFDSSCQCDIILGGDFLQKADIKINYTECQVEWINRQLPLQKVYQLHKEDKNFLFYTMYVQEEEEWFGDNFMESLATTILDANYKKVDLYKIINDQKFSKKNESNCAKSLSNWKNYLMEHLVFIQTERYT